MQVLPGRSSDAEGLLHEPIRFVSVPIRLSLVMVLVATAARVGGFTSTSPAAPKTASSLALHLPIGEETTGDAAGTPRFPVGPSPHSRFPLVPNEN